MMPSSVEISTSSTPRNNRHIRDYDEDDPTGPNFIDHFSLREPSSTVKFRGARVHVYETTNEQILLEDRRSSKDIKGKHILDIDDDDNNGKNRHRHRHKITVKRMQLTTFGMFALRAAYTVIALLLFGYLFAFAFQIILFLFVNLAADILRQESTPFEEKSDNLLAIFSTLLSAPVFLFGFSSMMAIASTFVREACSGGHLIRAVIGAPAIVKELLYFFFFLLIPALTLIGSLFARSEDPWRNACYSWFFSVAFVFCVFGLAIVWCEVAACFRLLSIHYCDDVKEYGKLGKILLQARRAALLAHSRVYSGEKSEQYLVTGDDIEPDGGYTYSDKHNPTSVRKSLYTYITQLGCLRFMFNIIDPPKRVYSVEEVRDVLPFITTHSWSLETMFFTGKRNRKIITAKGHDALTSNQIISNFACNILGSVIIILALVGYLVWLNSGLAIYILVGVFCIICFLMPLIRNNVEMLKMYKDINREDEKSCAEEASGGVTNREDNLEGQLSEGYEEEEETTMFRLWETSRITTPKVWVCYIGMVFEIVLLFLLPATVLFTSGNGPIGWVFLVVAIFSFLRKYFDAAVILCELGSMSNVDVEKHPGKKRKTRFFASESSTFQGEEKTLVLKSRLGDIVGDITRNAATTRWTWFFGFLLLLCFFLFALAIASDGNGLGDRPPIVLVDDYFYPSEKSLQYPTCALGKEFQISVDGVALDTSLQDYGLLTVLSYETTNVTSYILPQWFGEGEAIDEDEFVNEFRREQGHESARVFFKFFTFPRVPDVGVIAIRGSQTVLDWMVNFQLWSASALAQCVKWVTPYGWIWTPILKDLVWVLSAIQAEELDEVSYYKVTTSFANKFKGVYGGMRVTGGSLGGGLAIITGAQARVPAVAISAPGAELSRETLTPRISEDDINKYVFNFIPDRDVIARVGGRPRQHQEAQCRAEKSNLFGCHSLWQSLCEMNYRCGSNGRPVPCRCHFDFGFPEPEPIGTPTRSFKEACYEQEQTFLNATGSSIGSGWWKS